jgi:hypothetical protein
MVAGRGVDARRRWQNAQDTRTLRTHGPMETRAAAEGKARSSSAGANVEVRTPSGRVNMDSANFNYFA